MKLIRLAVISFILLFIAVFSVSLFIPSHVRISRAINIEADKNTVLAEIDDLNRWKDWYPGFDTITIIPIESRDGKLIAAKTPGTVLTLKERRGDEVIAEFKSGKANPIISGWKAIGYAYSDSLTVQWYLDFRLHWYPWEKLTSLLYEKTYGPQMEKGLGSLKKMVEK